VVLVSLDYHGIYSSVGRRGNTRAIASGPSAARKEQVVMTLIDVVKKAEQEARERGLVVIRPAPVPQESVSVPKKHKHVGRRGKGRSRRRR